MIEPMSIEVVFTSESTATGGGREGHVKSSTGKIDLDTNHPKEMGGSGVGTNPEELFSAGYSACFLGALRLVAKNNDIALDDASATPLRVNGGFFIFRPQIFDYLREGEELVDGPFRRLIDDKQLVAYQYDGFWKAMDTFKDKQQLDALYAAGAPPWEVWRPR